ncbi:DUF4442 domain-containing protein [Flavobacterium aurantiibacter]|uniref:Thioesterase n=1 Tax=Flavobacterium aurantiibacter TaxID=2023067 RepID=A0A256A5W9_9FLAO|nr:DUF4442 domain-containing protein [Flavobacterium aurantiibacter]OYQ49092.1 thioesterase [Flavobacterium aurantiibacter]
MTVSQVNQFLFFKLPSAYLCGVRVKKLDAKSCTVDVTHRWINQNPFNSMYFAVQAMAAELATGALVMNEIQQSKKRISMLVARNESVFTKKATGKIVFTCLGGETVHKAVSDLKPESDNTTFWLEAVGTNESGQEVSRFRFEWTLKLKA